MWSLAVAALAQQPRVLGGTPSPEGRWPDAVALYSGEQHICTGTLIAPDLVLSAEHCYGVTHAKVGVIDHTTGTPIDVVERFDHPDAPMTADVSLFRLAEPSDVEPRDLLVDCLSGFYVDGVTVTVAGFGFREANGPGQELLIEADIPIEDADCSDLSRGCRAAVSPGGELIAGGDGIDSCIGDSGGPLYLDTGEGIYLAGVVSRGAFPASALCGDGGIYVRTDAIAPWIEDTTGIVLDRPPDCEALNRPPDPIFAAVEVTQGRTAAIEIDPNDPDPDDTHLIEVVGEPEQGFVSDDLLFTAEPFQVGVDIVRLAITDSGSPPRTIEVDVPIHVFPAGVLDDEVGELPRGCACSSTPTPAALLWPLLVLGVARSRRQKTSHARPSASS